MIIISILMTAMAVYFLVQHHRGVYRLHPFAYAVNVACLILNLAPLVLALGSLALLA